MVGQGGEIKLTIPGQARTPQTGQVTVIREGVTATGKKYRNAKLFPGKLYRQYKKAALQFIACAKIPSTVKLPLTVLIRVTPVWYHKDKRRRDEDNLKKGLGDILKSSRLIIDDHIIRWGECGHFIDKDNPLTEVVITEA